MKKTIWDGKPWQAFKTFAIIFSFTINFVLILVLLVAAPIILPIVNDIAKPIVGGLSDSFVEMKDASIIRTIPVNDEIPIEFTLPLEETTNVVLSEAVPLNNLPAQFILPSAGGSINGQVSIELPKGLILPVELSLEVPVEQTIPISLDVQVEIPLDETELGTPFGTLQSLFQPLDKLLNGLPSSNEELFQRVLDRSTQNGEVVVGQAQ